MSREEVVSSTPFLTSNSRWSGAAEVIKVTRPDGTVHIELRLRIGTRYVVLPKQKDVLAKVLNAVESSASDSRGTYEALIREMNG